MLKPITPSPRKAHLKAAGMDEISNTPQRLQGEFATALSLHGTLSIRCGHSRAILPQPAPHCWPCAAMKTAQITSQLLWSQCLMRLSSPQRPSVQKGAAGRHRPMGAGMHSTAQGLPTQQWK